MMTINYEEVLYWKDRTLQLLLAIDRIRDRYDDEQPPDAMFRGLAALMQSEFEADACALAVVEEVSSAFEFVHVTGFDAAIGEALCREALDSPGITDLEAEAYPYTLGIQVILREYPLAGLVLARKSKPFSVEERGLLQFAESQIDSAVTQAHTVWKLMQRNRELEAVYQIDQLRGYMRSEQDLIAGVTSVLLEQYQAKLCLIFLRDADNSDLQLCGRVDQGLLGDAAIDSLRSSVSMVQIPQEIVIDQPMGDLRLFAAPVSLRSHDQKRSGAVVIGRDSAFSMGDHRLMYVMLSQLD